LRICLLCLEILREDPVFSTCGMEQAIRIAQEIGSQLPEHDCESIGNCACSGHHFADQPKAEQIVDFLKVCKRYPASASDIARATHFGYAQFQKIRDHVLNHELVTKVIKPDNIVVYAITPRGRQVLETAIGIQIVLGEGGGSTD